MAMTTMHVSVTSEMRRSVERRIRSGQYGNSSDVIRAALRALEREEMGAAWKTWEQIRAKLPQDPTTPDIEQRVESRIRQLRRAQRRETAA